MLIYYQKEDDTCTNELGFSSSVSLSFLSSSFNTSTFVHAYINMTKQGGFFLDKYYWQGKFGAIECTKGKLIT